MFMQIKETTFHLKHTETIIFPFLLKNYDVLLWSRNITRVAWGFVSEKNHYKEIGTYLKYS